MIKRAILVMTMLSVMTISATPLFNGKDLTGWYKFLKGHTRNDDPKNVITASNGVIRITGEEWGSLITEKEYENYRLIVEYRFTGKRFPSKKGKALDSGILFHSTGPDGGFAGIWMFSHEYNLIVGASGDIWTVGSPKVRPDMVVEGEVNGKKVALKGNQRIPRIDIAPDWVDSDTAKIACNEKPIGEWNTAMLVCRGEKVECYFNGKFVNSATRVVPAKGKIQLQSEGCEIEFRKVEISSL